MAANRTSPTRTCVGCGERDAQAGFVRLRRQGERLRPVTDYGNGRSAYVHPRTACVNGLLRSRVLGKSLRVTVAKEARIELIQALEEQLASQAFAAPAK